MVPGELGQVLGGQHDAPLIALVGPPDLWQLVHFLEEGLGQSPHIKIDTLMASFKRVWSSMSMVHISKVCRANRPRLEAMVAAQGGTMKNEP